MPQAVIFVIIAVITASLQHWNSCRLFNGKSLSSIIRNPICQPRSGYAAHKWDIYAKISSIKNRDGSLFLGRYRACLIEKDNYLIQVSRYIHLNPVIDKICKLLQDYYWSSYRYFLGLEQPPPWLKLTDTLQFFGNDSQELQYQQFVENEIDNIESTKKITNSSILGSKVFIQIVTKRFFQKAHQVPEIPTHKQLPLFPSFEQIQTAVANYFNITNEELVNSKPKITNFPKHYTFRLH